jgi:uncharacterized protein (PEP-CTERM system associated)
MANTVRPMAAEGFGRPDGKTWRTTMGLGFALILALPAGRAAAQMPLSLAAPTSAFAPLRPGGPNGLAPDNSASAPSDGAPPAAGSIISASEGLEGYGYNPSGMDFPFSTVAPPPGIQGRGWSITPSIAAQVLGTDNLAQTTTQHRSDFITTITPGLLVAADTSRLQGIANFSPYAQIYARDTSQTRINQRYNGQFLVTMVPDALFVDIRGAAAVQAAGGGYSTQGTPVIDRNNQVQTQSFQISPYYVHRFADTATAQFGYAFQSVRQGLGGNGAGGLTAQGTPFFSSQDFTANEGYGVIRTGPDFGRLAAEGRVVSTDYDGTGVLRAASRRIVTIETRYSITRQFAVLAEGGYESQRYSGSPPYRLSEAVWGFGARLTLSEQSAITVKYTHRNGFDSPVVNAVFGLGGRTRIFANYAETLTTGAQRAVDMLSTTTLDALGNPVDAATGAPVAQPFADSFLGTQSSLQRVRRGTVAISQAWPRDIITLSFSYEQRRPIALALGSTAVQQRGTSATLTWSHVLTPATTFIGSLQYGRFDQPGGVAGQGSSDVFSASATLTTQFNPGLTGFVQYGLSNRVNEGQSGHALQNLVIIGLRQSF